MVEELEREMVAVVQYMRYLAGRRYKSGVKFKEDLRVQHTLFCSMAGVVQ